MEALSVRKAVEEDIPQITGVYRKAKKFMVKNGNTSQWLNGYPSRELIADDIKRNVCYVITAKGGKICGVFAYIFGEDSTYANIYGGSWLNDEAYATVHRIASDGSQRGIFRTAIEFCKKLSENIRIDTHENNKIMQKLITENGFLRCGTIYIHDGTPRIAYHYAKGIGTTTA